MNFLELVKNRYSCRAYKPLSVEKEKLDYILECVRFAPSAVNKQPWRFHVVSKDEDKARLQQCYSRDWFKSGGSPAEGTGARPCPYARHLFRHRAPDGQGSH